MGYFFSSKFTLLKKWVAKLPGFSPANPHSLGCLNAAQFLGVINDNIYKLVLVFFLIDLEGKDKANLILSAAGAIFVIPFLLFSSTAGILADRFSKSRLISALKAVEILIMLLVVISFFVQSKWGGYTLLFLLSTHSALFGPSKYGIIPELVPKSKISKANGLITSFTYLAIIVGTFLASFMTEITGHHFVLVAGFCLIVALLGFISTFGIQYTPPKGIKKKINFFFVKEIFKTLKICKQKNHLIVAISGSSFFLFIGAFTQLNIIPFAIDQLEFNEVAGGYLFLITALGIALGAFLAGRASKKNIELGLPCLAGLFIALLFCLLAYFSAHSSLVVLCLFFLGVFGGNFVVPFDSYIQLFSPEKQRGGVIGATNFLSFCGVLCASFALFLFNEVLGLSSANSFLVIGLLTFLFSIFLFLRLSDLASYYLSKKMLHRYFKISTNGLSSIKHSEEVLLILPEGTWFKAWILSGLFPNLHFLLAKERKKISLQNLCYSIHYLSTEEKLKNLIDRAKSFQSNDLLCLFLKRKATPEEIRKEFSFREIFTRDQRNLILIDFEKKSARKIQIHFHKQ